MGRRDIKNQIEDLKDYVNENEVLQKKIEELKKVILELAPYPRCFCKVDRNNQNYKKLLEIGCKPKHSSKCIEIRKKLGLE